MKNIYIIGLLWACSTWTMADTVVNAKTVTPQQIAKANTIRVTSRPEIMGLCNSVQDILDQTMRAAVKPGLTDEITMDDITSGDDND